MTFPLFKPWPPATHAANQLACRRGGPRILSIATSPRPRSAQSQQKERTRLPADPSERARSQMDAKRGNKMEKKVEKKEKNTQHAPKQKGTPSLTPHFTVARTQTQLRLSLAASRGLDAFLFVFFFFFFPYAQGAR